MFRIRYASFILLMGLSSSAVAQVQLELLSPDVSYVAVVPIRTGGRLAIGTTGFAGCSTCTHRQLVLTVLGSAAHVAFTSPRTSGNDVPFAAAVDPQGNVWIVGSTDSGDFNLVNPVVAQKAPGRVAGFVMEFNPTGDKVLFATYLCGNQPSSGVPSPSTYANAITIDSAGNAYIGGQTNEPDFPTTPGAFLRTGPGRGSFGDWHSYSYLAKISPAGKLVYSTLVTTGGGCTGSLSGCIGRQSSSASVDGAAVDSSGAVTLTGTLGATVDIARFCVLPGGSYIRRVAPDGSKISQLRSDPIPQRLAASFVALDSSGHADLFGVYVPSIQNPSSICPTAGTPGLFAAQLNSDGSDFIWSIDLGQSADTRAAGILVDSADNLYVAGTSSSPQFLQTLPAAAGVGADFILKLDTAGSAVRALRFPAGVIAAAPAFGGNGDLVLLGVRNSLLTLPADYSGQGPPAIVAFGNAASYALNTGLFPGALLTLWGFNLPASSDTFQLLVNGVPAPILYAGPNQINIQVPFKSDKGYLALQTVQLIASPEALSFGWPGSRSVGLFTTDGVHATALNLDGTLNSPSNPAAYGSVVSLFGTGAWWPSGTHEGATPSAAVPFNPDLNQFEAISGNGTHLNIPYAGTAPGVIDGVFRMDVQLTETVSGPAGAYQITLRSNGSVASNAVLVYVR